MPHVPLRLTLDSDALIANWRWLARASGGAACGAAIKADAYGLGVTEAAERLADAGCRDFFVATWAEAAEALPAIGPAALSVLHGVGADDMPAAMESRARPILNTIEQVRRWRETGRPCDVMIDTGINRLGLAPSDVAGGALAGLVVDTIMSHLACADEDHPKNGRQLAAFRAVTEGVSARRRSLANSAGIALGRDYAFELTRPGVALYGGVPRPEMAGRIAPVARIETQILQRRRIGPGDSVGYNATFVAERPMELAILNLGYADGYMRGFSGTGRARKGEGFLPVVGRVSMDLVAIAVDAAPELKEGDWVEVDFDLPDAAAQSGLAQYELLTALGRRYQRRWT